MVEGLAARVGGIQTSGSEAHRALQELGPQEAGAIQERIMPLRRHLDALMQEAGFFRVHAEPPVLPLDAEPTAESAASETPPEGG